MYNCIIKEKNHLFLSLTFEERGELSWRCNGHIFQDSNHFYTLRRDHGAK